MQPGRLHLAVRKSATPVCGAWNPLGTQISALDDPRSCGLGNAPIPYMKRVSEAGDICQHFRRQFSPEANRQRALPSAPYFSIGAPTMLPYSVQEPS